MERYFFDFDGVTDLCGVTMPTAKSACSEALLSMPEYVAEQLEHDGGKAEMTCVVRASEMAYKIVVTIRVEDKHGAVLEPFQLETRW